MNFVEEAKKQLELHTIDQALEGLSQARKLALAKQDVEGLAEVLERTDRAIARRAALMRPPAPAVKVKRHG